MNRLSRQIAGSFLAIFFCFAIGLSAYSQQNKASDPEYIKTKSELKENEQFRNLPLPDFDTSKLISDVHTQKVKELMKQLGVMDVAIMSVQSLLDKQAEETNPFLQEFYGRMVKEMKTGRMYRYMEDAIIRIYRESFTVAEIDQLMVFYATPVGKKTISVLPALTQSGSREGEKIGKYMGMLIIHEMINE